MVTLGGQRRRGVGCRMRAVIGRAKSCSWGENRCSGRSLEKLGEEKKLKRLQETGEGG